MKSHRNAAPPASPIAEPLRLAVARQQLSATALAHASGVDVRSVSRWIRGEKDLTLATADRLAVALNLRLGDAPRRPGPARAPSSYQAPHRAQLEPGPAPDDPPGA